MDEKVKEENASSYMLLITVLLYSVNRKTWKKIKGNEEWG